MFGHYILECGCYSFEATIPRLSTEKSADVDVDQLKSAAWREKCTFQVVDVDRLHFTLRPVILVCASIEGGCSVIWLWLLFDCGCYLIVAVVYLNVSCSSPLSLAHKHFGVRHNVSVVATSLMGDTNLKQEMQVMLLIIQPNKPRFPS